MFIPHSVKTSQIWNTPIERRLPCRLRSPLFSSGSSRRKLHCGMEIRVLSKLRSGFRIKGKGAK
jgi:hypothetical protein